MKRGWLAEGAVAVLSACLVPWAGMADKSVANNEKIVKEAQEVSYALTVDF